MRSEILLTAGLVVASLLASSPARADLPPPDGTKFVDYGFTVSGLPSDRVLFAFPCGGSNGAPTKEYQKIEAGVTISVGRRGGGCTIYSIDKAAFETWSKSYAPTKSYDDPGLDQLAAQSLKCTGGPSPSFTMPSSYAGSSKTETFHVTKSDATACSIAMGPAEATPVGSGKGAPETGTPVEPVPIETVPNRGGGCAGCAVGGDEGGVVLGLVGAGVAIAFAAWRRRRPGR